MTKYKVYYEIILKDIEPFSIITYRLNRFLKQLLKDNLISGYTLKIKE